MKNVQLTPMEIAVITVALEMYVATVKSNTDAVATQIRVVEKSFKAKTQD